MVDLHLNHYIVHGFQAHDEIINIKGHCRRDSLVTYPRVFRYQTIRSTRHSTVYLINEYFSVLCFQPIPAENLETAKSLYESSEAFDGLYRQALRDVADQFGVKFGDADFSLCLHFASDLFVSWSECRLQRIDSPQLVAFIEACFLYQLLAEVRRKLPLITERRRSFVFQRTMVDQVEDLFWAELPAGYLISEVEIKYADLFYKAWDLGESIKQMRDRFGQSVGNHTFFYDLVARDREQVVSLLLTAIALFSAYGVRDVIVKNIPFVSPGMFDIVFLVLFSGVTTAAICMGIYLFGRRLGAWLKWWRNSRLIGRSR